MKKKWTRLEKNKKKQYWYWVSKDLEVKNKGNNNSNQYKPYHVKTSQTTVHFCDDLIDILSSIGQL